MRRKATCFECGEDMEETGRNTLYCPSCDVCPECRCPNADGFQHHAGCDMAEETLFDREFSYPVEDFILA